MQFNKGKEWLLLNKNKMKKQIIWNVNLSAEILKLRYIASVKKRLPSTFYAFTFPEVSHTAL